MAETKARRRRERLTRSDGAAVVIAKPPRADVLWYPRNRWTTVLVRRTHNLDLARELAEERWAQLDDVGPLVGQRIGWWTTYATKNDVPGDAAEDQLGRVVRWVEDDTTPGAGPGIEFRP